MSVAATWAPSCSGLCNWWQLVLVWIVAAGTVGVAASQALSPQLAGGGSWWQWWAAGPRCWAVGRGSDGQHPVGARVWLGQAVQDGGRWEPRVRRKKAGGRGPRWGSPLFHQKLGSHEIRTLGLGVRHASAGSAARSPAGGHAAEACGPQFPCLHQGMDDSIIYAIRFL